MKNWQIIQVAEAQALGEARLQLHYAIQLLAAVGNHLIPHQSDSSEVSLGWHSDLKSFLGGIVEGDQPFQVGINPYELSCFIITPEGKLLQQTSLINQSLEQGMDWLKLELSKLGAPVEGMHWIFDRDDFPDHPLKEGGSFTNSGQEKREAIADLFGNSHILLEKVISSLPGASPVRIWPHHFDIATLVSLLPPEGEQIKTVGVGMTPGDDDYGEPYWYVTPWPYPEATATYPTLAGGGLWHTQGWVGAVLKASQLGQDLKQSEQVEAFLLSGIKLLGK